VAQKNADSRAFKAFVADSRFPCVAAKSALQGGRIELVSADDLRNDTHDTNILAALYNFPHKQVTAHKFFSLAILFHNTPQLSEESFERYLWERLAALHRLDAARFGWDRNVSADAGSPKFSMSFGGHGFYVIGMHSGASRAARRTSCPTMVFNSHSQFHLLREAELFDRMRDIIRKRDLTLQGTINPMLADHGERSEAAQYAGRQVPHDWVCPFKSSAK